MIKSQVKDKEKEATIQLLKIGDEKLNTNQRWVHSSFENNKLKNDGKMKNKIVSRTENNSPILKVEKSIRETLKMHLQELKKGSIEGWQAKSQQRMKDNARKRDKQIERFQYLPLKCMNINLQLLKTKMQLWRNREQNKPLVSFGNHFKKQEQEKIRSIIRKKVIGKNLFKTKQLQPHSIEKQNQSHQLLIEDSTKSIKKNIFFHNYRNFLPPIFPEVRK